MLIEDKIQEFINGPNHLNESGIPNIKKWSKAFDEAIIYFHVDLDGVTSAIGMKAYLESYGIKVVDAVTIQYGNMEYAIKKPEPGQLVVAVDFAHAKPMWHIWTDHHDGEKVGVTKDMSVSFVHAPSNAAHISGVLSPKELFPPEDLKTIDIVDSADFARNGLTPDDIMRAAFKVDKSISVKGNRRAMGLVVNKLLLSFKNKPGFLREIVMRANPSLVSMYNVIKDISKKWGYIPPEEVEQWQQNYNQAQKEKIIKDGSIKDIPSLKSGESILINNVVVQYGGGAMFKGNKYDRYTVFKNHPTADFLVIGWPMGLIQASKNPFKGGDTPIHLGELALGKILPKYKNQINSKIITLFDLKRIFESDIEKKGLENTVGFTFNDLITMLDPQDIRGVTTNSDSKWTNIIKDIAAKPLKHLTRHKQKELLKKVEVHPYKLIINNSGGHRAITNITALNFLGKGYTDWMKKTIMTDLVKELSKHSLVD